MNPWDYLPALTTDRLSRVADILRRSRDSAARHAKRTLGDSLCSIGFVGYERSCNALARASKDEYRDWLSVEPLDHHFIIKICGIPARFYRGDAALPIPAKTLKLGPLEEFQTALALQTNGMKELVQCLRFEVEKQEKGFTKAVNFVIVGADNDRFLSWPIPRFVAKHDDSPVEKGAVRLPPISLDGPAADPRSDEKTA